MQLKDYSFKKLSFPSLFQTYVTDFNALEEFYEYNPFSLSSIKKRIAESSLSPDRRSKTAKVLKKFNSRFDLADAALDNLERLEDKNSLTIVTGQQLGLYGGPIFTAYKSITAIHLARQLEKKLQLPVIPVFWLADEDHDYDEVRSVNLLEKNQLRRIELPAKNGLLPPVAEMLLPGEIKDIEEKAREILLDTDYSDELWKFLNGCFLNGSTRFDQAFGDYLARLFSKHGMILAGSNEASTKRVLKDSMKKSISDADCIRDAIERQSAKIEERYHRQATVYDSNLFYRDESEDRIKVNRSEDGDGWKIESGKKWTSRELIDEIEHNPERFSPNVFLRPILQDKLLPTLGYVAGPGEAAYFGQMKSVYTCFDLHMPVIFPRLSATLVEPAIDRIMDELPFELYEYKARIEDLETSFVDRTEEADIERIFSIWKKKTMEISEPGIKQVKDIDPTLEASAEKATALFFNELDTLKGKVYRSVKKGEQTQLERIRRIKAQLFPERELQERAITGIYYMNKYGIGIWDDVLNALDEDESFNQHKLIYL